MFGLTCSFPWKKWQNNQFDLKKRSDIHSILSPTSFNSLSRRTRQLPPSRLRPNFSRSNAQPTSIPRYVSFPLPSFSLTLFILVLSFTILLDLAEFLLLQKWLIFFRLRQNPVSYCSCFTVIVSLFLGSWFLSSNC